MIFGEGTPKSGRYRVRIDGAIVENKNSKTVTNEFDAASIAGRSNGNTHHAVLIAAGLDASVEHTLEIEPILSNEIEQELRLESICVAGGEAKVMPY